MKILHRYTQEVLWESPCSTMRETAVKAVASKANLCYADLRGADLRGANLCYADLRGANLCYAENAELAIARTRILPQGSIIGWKKCARGEIVKLRIPEDAKRSHAFGRKCRCEFADVMEIVSATGESLLSSHSDHDNEFTYRVGERATPDKFSEDWQEECSNGIHFYITREEAEAHV